MKEKLKRLIARRTAWHWYEYNASKDSGANYNDRLAEALDSVSDFIIRSFSNPLPLEELYEAVWMFTEQYQKGMDSGARQFINAMIDELEFIDVRQLEVVSVENIRKNLVEEYMNTPRRTNESTRLPDFVHASECLYFAGQMVKKSVRDCNKDCWGHTLGAGKSTDTAPEFIQMDMTRRLHSNMRRRVLQPRSFIRRPSSSPDVSTVSVVTIRSERTAGMSIESDGNDNETNSRTTAPRTPVISSSHRRLIASEAVRGRSESANVLTVRRGAPLSPRPSVPPRPLPPAKPAAAMVATMPTRPAPASPLSTSGNGTRSRPPLMKKPSWMSKKTPMAPPSLWQHGSAPPMDRMDTSGSESPERAMVISPRVLTESSVLELIGTGRAIVRRIWQYIEKMTALAYISMNVVLETELEDDMVAPSDAERLLSELTEQLYDRVFERPLARSDPVVVSTLARCVTKCSQEITKIGKTAREFIARGNNDPDLANPSEWRYAQLNALIPYLVGAFNDEATRLEQNNLALLMGLRSTGPGITNPRASANNQGGVVNNFSGTIELLRDHARQLVSHVEIMAMGVRVVVEAAHTTKDLPPVPLSKRRNRKNRVSFSRAAYMATTLPGRGTTSDESEESSSSSSSSADGITRPGHSRPQPGFRHTRLIGDTNGH